MLVLAFSSCERIHYRYKITGNVEYKGKMEPAIWYTDTFATDSTMKIRIVNSNGTGHVIDTPYTIYVLK